MSLLSMCQYEEYSQYIDSFEKTVESIGLL